MGVASLFSRDSDGGAPTVSGVNIVWLARRVSDFLRPCELRKRFAASLKLRREAALGVIGMWTS